MKIEITDYESFVGSDGMTEETFSGNAYGTKFIALHSFSEHCGAEWSNGAIRGEGFEILFDTYGDEFIDAIRDWMNIYTEIVENATNGLEHKANEVFAKELEVA